MASRVNELGSKSTPIYLIGLGHWHPALRLRRTPIFRTRTPNQAASDKSGVREAHAPFRWGRGQLRPTNAARARRRGLRLRDCRIESAAPGGRRGAPFSKSRLPTPRPFGPGILAVYSPSSVKFQQEPLESLKGNISFFFHIFCQCLTCRRRGGRGHWHTVPAPPSDSVTPALPLV